MLGFKRTLRTASSERFSILRGGTPSGTVDLHYLPAGEVAGTVVLFRSVGWTEEQISDLMAAMDEELLPGVDQSHGGFGYTVVEGEVVGLMESSPPVGEGVAS